MKNCITSNVFLALFTIVLLVLTGIGIIDKGMIGIKLNTAPIAIDNHKYLAGSGILLIAMYLLLNWIVDLLKCLKN